MAHFAILDIGNIVQQVVTVGNEIAITEQAGINFLKQLYNNPNLIAVQTSYNTIGGKHLLGGTPLRANFAGINYIYDATNDIFYPSKIFPSWTISAPTWLWQAPIPYPTDGKTYLWNETTKTWVGI
jgi:hypothetical protein